MADSTIPRTIASIQKKLDKGDVVILTAREIGDRVRNGETLELTDIDVVTTATSALMSGTYAVLSFQVAQPDTFTKAEKVWINSVPAMVGPCPNERIGLLDLIILGTQASISDPRYGAGNLFRDLVQGKEVRVDIETDGGKKLSAATTLKQIPHAMLHASRNAFKNYVAFVNPGTEDISTIFHSDLMKGNYEEMTFCGCGELNPIENDPDLKTIGIGTQVLINGAPGFVTGAGTRSCVEKPNLTGMADMHQMDPELMGGFTTGHGPDIITTWAVAIPVLDKGMLTHILKTDDQIPLKVVDIHTRIPIHEITYGHVWKNKNDAVTFNPKECQKCDVCQVTTICPADAVHINSKKGVQVDPSRCFHCGLCISRCKGDSFVGNLGNIKLEGVAHKIPVTIRQSNRVAALRAAEDLKQQLRDGRFKLTEPVGKINLPPEP